MPPIVTGIIASLLLLINTLFWSCLLFPLTFLKVIIPVAPVRKVLTSLLAAVANAWISCNSGWMILTQKMNWTIERPDNLSRNGWYFVLSNHQSWVDILVLQHTLNGRIPLLKFFLKQELIKVPIMGAAWWALDFPFMKRYSKEYLAKHPEMKGKDLDTTRAACEKFKDMPTSVMNFLEGTRFTQKKHDETGSPFKHLLKPKAGGMAFAMSAMGDQFQSILDVTINYPDGIPTFWDFMQGKMPRCNVIVEEKPIPAELINGDYETDDSYRLHFQQWVQKLWEEKDARLEALRNGQ
ncbi:MAG: acyltransferase [Thalassolituus sp.]|jgi:1-acyl-sn-glycerol-3-phosphate acyltransferase|uniref:acyltransferase n=1 Tax=unclassified Thalassolituus TaxID=2624967 RepID=UPI000C0DDB12|nr:MULTISPECIES: acyltransferase [unclassified Thalassolituus]MBN57216.1 acyltransferase [Oceanospirillaceae bacterium]MDQ4424608.1 acyltransferase [Thalassolituus sp.]MDQ4426040.1 acyltransferase [Thalassolituus sp.]|tara:strand:- start:1295 stop:2179 length:885 start_codon:yes stop_codon:yes gene_type:complete